MNKLVGRVEFSLRRENLSFSTIKATFSEHGHPMVDMIVSAGGRSHRVAALVDTGADATEIGPGVVEALSLAPAGHVHIAGYRKYGPEPFYLVDAGLCAMGEAEAVVQFRQHYAVRYRTGWCESPHKALVGRDILRRAIFIYDGHREHLQLLFRSAGPHRCPPHPAIADGLGRPAQMEPASTERNRGLS